MPSTVSPERKLNNIDPVPDPEFRIVIGCHAALLAVGYLVVAALTAGRGTADLLVLGSMATFATCSTVVAVAAGQWQYGPERVGGSLVRYGFLLPGVVLVLAALAGWVANGQHAAVSAGMVFGTVTTFAGLLVAMMVRTRYVEAMCAGSRPTVSWRAETSQPAKRQRLLLAGVVLTGAMLAIVADVVVDYAYGSFAPGIGGIVGAVLGTTVRSERFHVHDSGIEIRRPANRSLVHWRSLDGYRLTDEELRLVRRWWVDYRHDRDEIEDVQAVVAALDEHLPPLSERSEEA